MPIVLDEHALFFLCLFSLFLYTELVSDVAVIFFAGLQVRRGEVLLVR